MSGCVRRYWHCSSDAERFWREDGVVDHYVNAVLVTIGLVCPCIAS